jgi:hypothetical protein
MVVDQYYSHSPTIRIVLLSQALQRSGTAHTFERGVRPQSQKDPWIGGRPHDLLDHAPRDGLVPLGCRWFGGGRYG